jgi:copper homeostasis protein
MPAASGPLLEVIALDVTDARNAEAGGADRIELVSEMLRWGLTPALETFIAVRAAVDLPIRTMLRQRDGFAAGDLDALRRAAKELRSAGADEFVLGFLDGRGAVDLRAVRTVLDAVDGRPWTFHRAIDYAVDRTAAWRAIAGLAGLDCVLTSGGPGSAGENLGVLVTEAGAGYEPRLLAGGGLREAHLRPLLAGGVDAFHTGTAVRRGHNWAAPVDPEAVRRWRARAERLPRERLPREPRRTCGGADEEER